MTTEFVFELREPADMPDAHDFGRFLCNRCGTRAARSCVLCISTH